MKTPLICCAAALLAGTATAAEPPTAAGIGLADALNVYRLTVQPLEVPDTLVAAFSVGVTLDDVPYTLNLHRYSLRDTSFRVLTTRPDGTLYEVEPPPPRTYRGEIVGEVVGAIGGSVAASLRDGRLTATMALDDGSVWHAESLDGILPPTPLSLHAVYRDDDAVPIEGACGVRARPRVEDDVPEVARAQGGGPGMTAALIAFDGDAEYYQLNGSSIPASIDDIEVILNPVNLIYERDVAITHFLTQVIIRTVNPAQYTSTDADTLLTGFENEWNANHGGVTRDVAHLMTGKNLDGSTVGLAETSVICFLQNFSYGLSQASFGGTFGQRVAVTAHELGHNWDALHCDEGRPGWAVDCSIMCSGIGGCTGNVASFGAAYAIGVIVAWRDSHNCTPIPPSPGKAGLNRNGRWYLDFNGSNSWDGSDSVFFFGLSTDTPLSGDWNADGVDEVGVYRNGLWLLDANGNFRFDAADAVITFGLSTDTPVVGDWDGDGDDDIGIFRNGLWFLDSNGNRQADGGDMVFVFGLGTDTPVTGDWNGDGDDDIGIFRNGLWVLDLNESTTANGGDLVFVFGLGTDTPLTGNWNATVADEVGIFRNGLWFLDASGNRQADGADTLFFFGLPTDKPVQGRWGP